MGPTSVTFASVTFASVTFASVALLAGPAATTSKSELTGDGMELDHAALHGGDQGSPPTIGLSEAGAPGADELCTFPTRVHSSNGAWQA